MTPIFTPESIKENERIRSDAALIYYRALRRSRDFDTCLIRRINHIVNLCKPLTGFPSSKYNVAFTKCKFRDSKTKIFIQTNEQFGEWQNKRYIIFPTQWLSAEDNVILKELNSFLDARNQRRELKKQLAYNAEKAEADRLDKYLKDSLARDPELAKAFKQAKAFVTG
jgi:hypothetical protein